MSISYRYILTAIYLFMCNDMMGMLCVVIFLLLIFCLYVCYFFFFNQKTAYEMRISDWSSDVCSSDLLFKTLAGVDAVDLELATEDVDRFVSIVSALEPSFGAINLEDIRAPDCFEIEERLQAVMAIPVLHDDQH